MPLSIEQIADSVGKKFLGWVTDNSGSNVAAAPKGVNLATQNGDQVADLAVSLDGEAVVLGAGSALIGKAQPADGSGNAATDDAAAAGPIYPAAGVYQATPDLVDSGDVGRVRMTAGRQVLVAGDVEFGQVHGVGSGEAYQSADWSAYRNSLDRLDLATALTSAAAALPFFDGDDAAFDVTPVWVWIPLLAANRRWNQYQLIVLNALGVNMTVSVYARMIGGTTNSLLSSTNPVASGGRVGALIDGAVVATNNALMVSPSGYVNGGGGVYTSTPENVSVRSGYLLIKMTPASDPAAGTWWGIACERWTE